MDRLTAHFAVLPAPAVPTTASSEDSADLEYVCEMVRLLSRPGAWPLLRQHAGEPPYEFATMLYLRLLRDLTPREKAACARGAALPRRVSRPRYVRLLCPPTG